jgi:hypothetical protein
MIVYDKMELCRRSHDIMNQCSKCVAKKICTVVHDKVKHGGIVHDCMIEHNGERRSLSCQAVYDYR